MHVRSACTLYVCLLTSGFNMIQCWTLMPLTYQGSRNGAEKGHRLHHPLRKTRLRIGPKYVGASSHPSIPTSAGDATKLLIYKEIPLGMACLNAEWSSMTGGWLLSGRGPKKKGEKDTEKGNNNNNNKKQGPVFPSDAFDADSTPRPGVGRRRHRAQDQAAPRGSREEKGHSAS